MKEKVLARVMKGLSKVLVLLLLLVLSPTRCDDDVLELFRTSCPYNNFCTMDNLKDVPQLNDTRYSPCCLDCFCDEACHAYRDCCPDVHLPQLNDTNAFDDYAECVTTITPTEFAAMDRMRNHNHYRMFDTCPSNYKDTDGIVDKCEEDVYSPDRRYEDAVIVSGPNNVMYRNIYCAMCRGATDVTRWQLKVIACQENLSSVRLGASMMKTYIMRNCTLVSQRPNSLTLNSRLLPCNRVFIQDCNDNVTISGTTDETIVESCANGPYMPYIDDSSGFIYKNAMCRHCNRHGEDVSFVCLDAMDSISRTSMPSLTSLLGTRHDASMSTRKTECDESQIMDYYANECRTLYCPPFRAALYGTCQQIASPALQSVMIRTVFWPTENITVTQPIKLYDGSRRTQYAHIQRERFSELNCPGMALYAEIQRERSTNQLLYVIVDSTIGLDVNKCTIRGIANVIRKQPSFNGSWVIDDKIMNMKGQHSFYRNPEEEVVVTEKEYILYERNFQVNFRFIDEFILCPYVEIGLDWYNKLVSMVGGPGNGTKLSSLSMKTGTLGGTYALSNSKLAMCVDRNMMYMFKPTNQAGLLLPSASQMMPIVLLWLVVMALLA